MIVQKELPKYIANARSIFGTLQGRMHDGLMPGFDDPLCLWLNPEIIFYETGEVGFRYPNSPDYIHRIGTGTYSLERIEKGGRVAPLIKGRQMKREERWVFEAVAPS